MLQSILAAGGHDNGFWVGDKNEFYWSTVAFLIVLGLFVWKGFPAVKAAMAKRTKRIADEIAAGEAKRADADRDLAKLKADLIARAESDAAELKNRARIEIEASKGQSLADLRQEVTRITLTSAEEIVNGSLDSATQNDLIEQYIRQLEGVR